MPLLASDYQTSQGQNPPGTLSNFNPGEFGDTYHIPVVPQEDIITYTTGAADVGWVSTVTNNVTGDSHTITYDPVDSAGVASATTADAATTFHNAWNSDPRALEFGRATFDSTTIVRITYNDDRVDYTLTSTPAGIGVAPATSPDVTNLVTQIEVGTFAYRNLDAAILAGADPRALVTPTGAIIEQFVGGIVRRGSLTNPALGSTLTYPVYGPSNNVPVVQRGVMAMRAAVDIAVGQAVSAVVSAGAGERDGWVTTGAGLTLPAGTTVYRGAKAGGICQIQFTVA